MRSLLLFLFILSMVSCHQEALSPAIDCMGDVTVDDDAFCDTEDPEDKFCEIRHAGSYELSQLSKSYMPLYCEDIGEKIIFTNGVGDDLEFTLADKGFVQASEMVVQDIICGGINYTKTTMDCIEYEKAFIRLESQIHVLELVSGFAQK